jgi:hypothetical protein
MGAPSKRNALAPPGRAWQGRLEQASRLTRGFKRREVFRSCVRPGSFGYPVGVVGRAPPRGEGARERFWAVPGERAWNGGMISCPTSTPSPQAYAPNPRPARSFGAAGACPDRPVGMPITERPWPRPSLTMARSADETRSEAAPLAPRREPPERSPGPHPRSPAGGTRRPSIISSALLLPVCRFIY